MTKVNVKEFNSLDELKTEVVRRARAVLGVRGYKKSQNKSICVDCMNDREIKQIIKNHGRIEGFKYIIADDGIALLAVRAADDTAWHDYDYSSNEWISIC